LEWFEIATDQVADNSIRPGILKDWHLHLQLDTVMVADNSIRPGILKAEELARIANLSPGLQTTRSDRGY